MDMIFRDLVDYWAKLRDSSSDLVRNQAMSELDKIMCLIPDSIMQDRYQDLIQCFSCFEQQLTQLKQQVNDQLEHEEKAWFHRSSQWYQETLDLRLSQHAEFPMQLRNQRARISDEAEQMYTARIMRYSVWYHAGMIIHPGPEPFMQHMVGSDPLYLVDESYELFEPVLSNYNEMYRRRLRLYVIEESFDRTILEKIPNSQIGVCLAYHYFDFRPFEMIKQYLIEIYQKLMPGGILIMTFNDCERLSGLTLVEINYACYNRATMIKDLALRLNYTVEFFWHDNGPSSWIELRKPGTLTSLRGGQTLAKIVPNPVANSK
jgi:hypothetical protein